MPAPVARKSVGSRRRYRQSAKTCLHSPSPKLNPRRQMSNAFLNLVHPDFLTPNLAHVSLAHPDLPNPNLVHPNPNAIHNLAPPDLPSTITESRSSPTLGRRRRNPW